MGALAGVLLTFAPGQSVLADHRIITSAAVDPGAYSPDSKVSNGGFDVPASTASLNSTFGDASFTGSASAIADYATLKVSASADLTNYPQESYESLGEDPNHIYGPGQSTFVLQPATATASFIETFTPTGSTGVGYLRVRFDVTGTTSFEATTAVDPSHGPGGAQGNFEVYRGSLGNGQSLLDSWGFTGDESLTSSLIHFTYGSPLTLSFSSSASIDAGDYVASDTPYDLHATADFGHTIKVAGLEIFNDADGTAPATGAAVSSESGTTYAVIVPEPSMLGLIMTTVPFLLRRKRSAV